MNSKQMFRVGEEVVLISASAPQYNGPATIVDAKHEAHHHNGIQLPAGWIYLLDIEFGGRWALQSSLYKKPDHETGEITEIMEMLNATV